jgi:hypothetical protein
MSGGSGLLLDADADEEVHEGVQEDVHHVTEGS